MKSQSIIFLSFIVTCALSHIVSAQTTYYSRQSGTWKDPDTWSTIGHAGVGAGNVPGELASDDIVIIAAGHVIDYNADDNASDSTTISALTIGTSLETGYLRFPFSSLGGNNVNELAGNYTLIVTGDVTLASQGYILSVEGGEENPAGHVMPGGAVNRTHNFAIQGNLTNEGTLDLVKSSVARRVDLEFKGTGNQVITGEGSWNFYNVFYDNSGTYPANQIENQSLAFTAAIDEGRSTFTQGTYVHNNSGTYQNQALSNDGTDYTNVSFIIQDGIFNMVNTTNIDPTIELTNGHLTVTGGQFNGGHGGVGSGFAANIVIDGQVNVSGIGVLNIGDGDPGTTTRPTDGTLTITGNDASSLDGVTCYTDDLILEPEVVLTVSNGATLEVGRDTGGLLTLNGNASSGALLIIDGVGTSVTIYERVNINQNAGIEQNEGALQVAPDFIDGGDPEPFQLDGEGARFTMLAGTFEVAASVNRSGGTDVDAIVWGADNTSVDLQGGTITLGNAGSGQGRLRFRQGSGETASLLISNSASVAVADAIQRNTAGSITNIQVTDNAALQVGLDNSSGNVANFYHEGTLTVANNAIVRLGRYGDLGDVNITESGTLLVGELADDQAKTDLNGTLTHASATATCTFFSGLDVEAGALLTITDGTIDILPNATTADDTRMQIRGSVEMNGGVINLGAGITDITNGNLLQVYDGGMLAINTGTFNLLSSPALTTLANRNPFNITNNDAGEDATPGDGIVTVGDGSGGANSASLIIAPNLAPQIPTPATRNLFDMDGQNSQLLIETDGYLQVGGGNIGNLRLNTAGARFLMQGGNCNITASLTIDNGTAVDISGGNLNIGTSSSNGANGINYAGNPNDTTRLTLSGGTINVGDGNSRLALGNDNEDPTFGTETAFSLLEITGGTFNLNGALNLDDANARFVMSSGNLNLNPQDEQNLDSDISIFDLEQGIVDITGGGHYHHKPSCHLGFWLCRASKRSRRSRKWQRSGQWGSESTFGR